MRPDGRLVLVIAEASLELVPRELWRHPAVYRNARRRGKRPGETLLDVSLHYDAMRRLPDREKRGRPDIVHFTLLEALSSPLSRAGKLAVYVHTVNDRVLYFKPGVRLPRNYNRFVGLMEQVLVEGRAPLTGEPLVWVEDKGFGELMDELGGSLVVGFSRRGEPASLRVIASRMLEGGIVVVGGFPHGFFDERVYRRLDEIYSIYPEGLEAWVVVSRILCALEEALNILYPDRKL